MRKRTLLKDYRGEFKELLKLHNVTKEHKPEPNSGEYFMLMSTILFSMERLNRIAKACLQNGITEYDLYEIEREEKS